MRKLVVLAVACLAASEAEAQQHESVRRAQAAYNDLDYAGAIAAARESLTEQLSRDERVSMYELLGFSYGALDSTSEAVAAFRRLIFLDPDREPDIERVSPRITSLYASALGQVLVVRRVRVDSATFVAGQGSVPVHFEVTRLARTRTRAVGQGLDMVVDSQLVAGGASGRFDWPVLDRSGTPMPEGEYQLVTTAIEEGQSEFSSSPQVVRVRHAMRDTLPALTSLPGYERQPEMVTPPRDWRPMLMSVLYTGIGAGAFLATENGHLGRGPRTALFSVSGLMIATGLAVSLRKPDARPSRPNILYNQLLGELLSKRNADIARENSVRRQQILITVVGVR